MHIQATKITLHLSSVVIELTFYRLSVLLAVHLHDHLKASFHICFDQNRKLYSTHGCLYVFATRRCLDCRSTQILSTTTRPDGEPMHKKNKFMHEIRFALQNQCKQIDNVHCLNRNNVIYYLLILLTNLSNMCKPSAMEARVAA